MCKQDLHRVIQHHSARGARAGEYSICFVTISSLRDASGCLLHPIVHAGVKIPSVFSNLDHLKRDTYPLVNRQKTMENHCFQWVIPLFLWSFSIAMLNYQRVLPHRFFLGFLNLLYSRSRLCDSSFCERHSLVLIFHLRFPSWALLSNPIVDVSMSLACWRNPPKWIALF